MKFAVLIATICLSLTTSASENLRRAMEAMPDSQLQQIADGANREITSLIPKANAGTLTPDESATLSFDLEMQSTATLILVRRSLDRHDH